MSGRRGRALRFCLTYLSQRLTPAGYALCLIWLIAALQGSTSFATLLFHIWSFTTVCLALAWLTSHFAAPNLTLTRRQPPPVTAGSPLTYEVEIENRSPRPAYGLRVTEMDIPAGLQSMGAASAPVIERLAPHSAMTLTFQLNSVKRGCHLLPGLLAASSYPLGLFRGLLFQRHEAYAIAHPTYAELHAFHLPRQSARWRADREAANACLMAETSSDFAYVREYRHGDSPRHLHWASWARTGVPATKVYHEETGFSVALILDTAAPNTSGAAAFESGISATAGIAAYLLRAGFEVDGFAAGGQLHRLAYDTPGKRLAHLLRALAGLHATPSVAWPSVAAHLMQQLPTCRAAVLIALDWSPDIAAFAAHLQHHGVGVRTLVIRHGPTSQQPPAADPPTLLLPGDPWPQDALHLPWRGP